MIRSRHCISLFSEKYPLWTAIGESILKMLNKGAAAYGSAVAAEMKVRAS